MKISHNLQFKIIIFTAVILSFFSLVNLVLAANEAVTGTNPGVQLQVPILAYDNASNIAQYIFNIYKSALYILVPIIAVIIMFGGILRASSGGDNRMIQQSTAYIRQGLIGLGIVLLSYLLLSLVGITQLKVPDVEQLKGEGIYNFQLYQLEDFDYTDSSVPPGGGNTGNVGTGNDGGPIVAGDIICPKDNCCDSNASGALQTISGGAGIAGCSASDCRIRQQTLTKLKAAGATAAQQGCKLQITSGFRSLEKQTELWNASQHGGNPAAHPDPTCKHAPHQTGGAIDVGIICGGKSCYPDHSRGNPNCANPDLKSVLEKIMFSVGFTRFSGEHWHFEYGTTKWQTNSGSAY